MTKNTRTCIRMTVSLFLTVFVVYYAIMHFLTDFHSLEASEPLIVDTPFQPIFLIDYTEHVPTCLLPEFDSGIGLRAPPYSSFLFV